MDNRPIGFFDSGLGGLTCITQFKRVLPQEKIIYFGDTARTPYGSKAVSTIKNFSMQIAEFLVKNDVKMIVIACNTVSSTCVEDLQQRFPDIPILGIIEPTAMKIAQTCDESNHIGIIGTKVTIKSGAYKNLIMKYNNALNIHEEACPVFVPLIEEGIIRNDIMDLTIRYYMDDFIYSNNLDTIVLGCTHYPLIRENIERLYPELKIVNPSEEIVYKIVSTLGERDMFAGETSSENTFYASDLSVNFVNMIDKIFENTDVNIQFKNLDIESV